LRYLSIASVIISVAAAIVSVIGGATSVVTDLVKVRETEANATLALEKIDELRKNSQTKFEQNLLELEKLRQELMQAELRIHPEINNLKSETRKIHQELSIQKFKNEIGIVRELRPVIRLTGDAKFRRHEDGSGVDVESIDFYLRNNGSMPIFLSRVVGNAYCDNEIVEEFDTTHRGVVAPREDFYLHIEDGVIERKCDQYSLSVIVEVEADETSVAIVKKYYSDVLASVPNILSDSARFTVYFDGD